MSAPWADLTRRYLARRDPLVLQQAIAAATSAQQPQIVALLQAFDRHDIAYVEGPGVALYESLRECGRAEEACTAGLLHADMFARLVEECRQLPLEHQAAALQLGLGASREALHFAIEVGDARCVAFYCFVEAQGLFLARNLDAARARYEEALAIRRELAATSSSEDLLDVALTLTNLGTTLSELRELPLARECCEEALTLFQRLDRDEAHARLPNVAVTLTSLASVLRDLREWPAAREALRHATAIYRELARDQPQAYSAGLGVTLKNTGNLLHDIRELSTARKLLEEALGLYRQLAVDQPQLHLEDVTTTLHSLGNVLLDLHELPIARECYEQALSGCRRLAHDQPGMHLPTVAMTLNGLGAALRRLGERRLAREVLEEALAVYGEPARHQPRIYLPRVAATLNNLANTLYELGDFQGARERCEGALALYGQLAPAQPELYEAEVATTLNNLGNALRGLRELSAARDCYERAVVIRRKLADQEQDVYSADLALTLNNLSGVLRELGELRAARQCFEESIALREDRGQWLDSARAHGNLALLAQDEGDAGGASQCFEACVERCERGLGLLMLREHRDVFKSQIEHAYLRLIGHYAVQATRGGEAATDRLVGLMESLRHVETLSGLERAPDGTDGWQAPLDCLRRGTQEISRKFREKRCAFLWVHAVPEGMVFGVLEPGNCRVEVGPPHLLQEFRGFFLEVERAIAEFDRAGAGTRRRLKRLHDALERAPLPEPERKRRLARLRHQEIAALQRRRGELTIRIPELGRRVFALLPAGVQDLLADDHWRTVFVAPCAGTIAMPFELLRVPGSRVPTGSEETWLGLRKLMPRVHRLGGLASILERQPVGRSALVVGNPLHHGFPHAGPSCQFCEGFCPACGEPGHCGCDPLPGAEQAARELASNLRQSGFGLVPDCEALLGPEPTTDAILAALLAPGLGLWVHSGHGGRPETGEERGVEYLALAGTDRLPPQPVAALRLPGTVVHHDCCFAGATRGRGGGRFDGHPTAALLAGASCVLASVHALWDDTAAEFSERLYRKALDPTRPLAMGEALMETRREMAAAYQNNPLVWATTVFWGNPWARLAQPADPLTASPPSPSAAALRSPTGELPRPSSNQGGRGPVLRDGEAPEGRVTGEWIRLASSRCSGG